MPDMRNMPPLHVVTQESLRLSIARDENTTAHDDDFSGNGSIYARTRGLCLSTEHILTRVVRHPNFSWQNGFTFMETPIQVKCDIRVSAIIAVNCLPRLLFGSILAHEMTHAHFRLSTRGYPQRLPQKVEEGLCQLVACLWTESEAKNTDDIDQIALAACISHQIRNDPSEIYGDGARAALARYEKFGVRDVFEHVRQCGVLPEA